MTGLEQPGADKKWQAVHEALRRLQRELEGKWPEPKPKRKGRQVRGYSRERGRRPV